MARRKKVDCPGPRGKFCKVRKVSPGKFDPRSFRVVKSGRVQIVIGCPKGKWNARKRRCRVGTQAQSVRYPLRDPKCRACPR